MENIVKNDLVLDKNFCESNRQKKFSIGFRLRKRANKKKEGLHSIYVRLYLDGRCSRSDITTSVKCLVGEWNSETYRIKGNTDLVLEKNKSLEKTESKILAVFNKIQGQNVFFDVNTVLDVYHGKTIYGKETHKQCVYLLAYTRTFHELRTTGLQPGTIKNYKFHLTKLTKYVRDVLKVSDIPIKDIDARWLMEYYAHCHNQFSKSHYGRRQIDHITQLLRFAKGEGVIDKEPVMVMQMAKHKPKPIKYLTEDEIKQIEECPFLDDKLQRVADAFLFCTYTGFAYNELKEFKPYEHIKNIQGTDFIIIKRGKTGTLCRIPLFKKAKEMLEKYRYRIPVICNQKMNLYIKEIGNVVGLSDADELTVHIARKTAGTLLLNSGVDIHTVSKILGHSSTRVTEQSYAELLTSTITQNVKHLL